MSIGIEFSLLMILWKFLTVTRPAVMLDFVINLLYNENASCRNIQEGNFF